MNTESVLPRTDERALSETEVAERLGVSPFTVRAWRQRGHGPRFMKIGRHVRYRLADVVSWENSRYADAGGPDAA